MKKSHQLKRKAPDYITEELATVLTSDEWFEFKPLFLLVRENLKVRNVASSGDPEMMRLRAYEKLQNLVQRGAVEKSGKLYRGNSKALMAFTEHRAADNCRTLLATLRHPANDSTDNARPQQALS